MRRLIFFEIFRKDGNVASFEVNFVLNVSRHNLTNFIFDFLKRQSHNIISYHDIARYAYPEDCGDAAGVEGCLLLL